ncbi:MAG: pyridoxal phosphate-dependent aminotransferase [Woeseiaceae bacterium]|nr:pyridoxal phosphate-dependent aminotransferase [Woeseiaceae bacterium]
MSLSVSERMSRVMPSATSAVLGLAAELREAGRPVISLGAGEPDFDTPEHIKEAAIKAIHDGETKYTAIDGTSHLKAAIQRKFQRDNQLTYAPEQILVSVGAKHTLFNACMGILSPGDEAIIPAPFWVSYPDMVRVAEGTPVIIETGIEDGFKVTPAKLEAVISDRTRILFLTSPSNPTGSCYTRAELEALGKVLVKHPNILVLADDIYEQIHWADDPFCSIATACPDLYDQVVTINGVSKCYAMTGWRVGYAGGPPEIIQAMKTIQSQITSNPCSISQVAAAAALNGDQSCMEPMLKAYKERSDYVVAALNDIPGFECREGEGAFYAFPRVTEAMASKGMETDADLVKLVLESSDVVMVPGTPFGAPGYVRISFACSIEELRDAMGRIRKALS